LYGKDKKFIEQREKNTNWLLRQIGPRRIGNRLQWKGTQRGYCGRKVAGLVKTEMGRDVPGGYGGRAIVNLLRLNRPGIYYRTEKNGSSAEK